MIYFVTIFFLQIRTLLGIPALVSVLSTVNEEGIVCRGCRTIANLAQDHRNAILLHHEGILQVMVKIHDEAESPKTRQVIVRAFRY